MAAYLARDLDGSFIGTVIIFDWEMPGGGRTQVQVTGALRQIFHSSHTTILSLTSHVHDVGGDMDEFEVSPDTPVTTKED